MLTHIIYYAGAVEVEDGRGRVVGSTGIVVDFGVSVDNCDFDVEVASEQKAEEEAGWASADHDDLCSSTWQTYPGS